MDVAALPINMTPQSTTAGTPGELPDDAAQPMVAPGVDLFAALLAKQIGVDTKGAPIRAETGDSTAPSVDTALQLQQAAIFMQVPANVPIETMAMQQATRSQTDAAATSLPVDVKGAIARQSVAADPAAFAVKEEGAGLPLEKIFSLKSAQADVAQVAAPSSPTPQPVGLTVQPVPLQSNNVAQPSSNIPQPVGHSAWGDMLGDRVVWMVSQQHQSVELHLNPPSLGPLEVRLSMNDGQASLSFSTQHLPVKEAIESAAPRLREMLGESGISLGSVSVNVGSFTQQQQPDAQAQSNSGHFSWMDSSSASDASSIPTITASLLGRNGMVDTFA